MAAFVQGRTKDWPPTPTTMKKALFIRSSSLHLMSLKHPGIFNLYQFSIDFFMTLLVIPLEIAGAVAMYIGIAVLQDGSAVGAIFAAVVALLIDIAAAWYLHQYECVLQKVPKLQNVLLQGTVDQREIAVVNTNQRWIAKCQKKAFLLTFLLFGLASLKAAVFIICLPPGADDGSDSPMLMGVVLGVIYASTAIIHCRYTGYGLGGFLFQRAWHRDLVEYEAKAAGMPHLPGGNGAEMAEPLPPHAAYNSPRLATFGHHRIEQAQNAKGEATFTLIRNGCINDQTIEQVESELAHDRIAAYDLVKACMKLQYRQVAGLLPHHHA